VLHPVGNLPAAVYWRRRALVLALLLSVLGGGGWGTRALLTRPAAATRTTVAAASAPMSALPIPALERVEPVVTGIRLPARYGRCADGDITVRLSAPHTAAAGTATTFRLVVTNTSAVPCVRALDRGLQKVDVLNSAGSRIWDSNDCVSLSGDDERTLTPRRAVVLPLAWNGLAGGADCAAPRVAPPPGSYVLRGRLDTVSAPATRLVLS
jgi:hypothetical protein